MVIFIYLFFFVNNFFVNVLLTLNVTLNGTDAWDLPLTTCYTTDLVTFTEEILNGKLHIFFSVTKP